LEEVGADGLEFTRWACSSTHRMWKVGTRITSLMSFYLFWSQFK